jgi:hypothetical protein
VALVASVECYVVLVVMLVLLVLLVLRVTHLFTHINRECYPFVNDILQVFIRWLRHRLLCR